MLRKGLVNTRAKNIIQSKLDFAEDTKGVVAVVGTTIGCLFGGFLGYHIYGRKLKGESTNNRSESYWNRVLANTKSNTVAFSSITMGSMALGSVGYLIGRRPLIGVPLAFATYTLIQSNNL